MRFAGLAEIEAYWELLRAGRAAPARADIDPRGIEAALGQAFIADGSAEGPCRLRLAGREACAAMGMELRGMPLEALILPADRAGFGALADQVLAGAARVEIDLCAPRCGAAPPLLARMIMLPLTGPTGVIDRMLGGLSIPGLAAGDDNGATACGAPRRFLVAGQQLRPAARSSGAGTASTAATKPELAESAAPFERAGERPARLRPTRAPHLRLVEPDRP